MAQWVSSRLLHISCTGVYLCLSAVVVTLPVWTQNSAVYIFVVVYISTSECGELMIKPNTPIFIWFRKTLSEEIAWNIICYLLLHVSWTDRMLLRCHYVLFWELRLHFHCLRDTRYYLGACAYYQIHPKTSSMIELDENHYKLISIRTWPTNSLTCFYS